MGLGMGEKGAMWKPRAREDSIYPVCPAHLGHWDVRHRQDPDPLEGVVAVASVIREVRPWIDRSYRALSGGHGTFGEARMYGESV